MNKRLPGIWLIAIFFAFSTCLVPAVGAAPMWPGKGFERVWSMYPAAAAAGAILFYLTRPKIREASATTRALHAPASRPALESNR